MLRPHIVFAGTLASLLACAQPAHAADPKPEIERKPALPQAVGKLHTLRSIPEACARLEGTFTGDAATPYKFNAVRTSERCGARARLVDAKTAKPSVANGWRLNDVIRVPNAGCPSQQAVVQVWRKDAKVAPPKLDAQGRAYSTGKRKNAIARVWVKPGTGKITINGKDQEQYFARPVLRMMIAQPLTVSDRATQYDVICTVEGSGLSGQAGAIRHGLSHALTHYEPELRKVLKPHGFLTRDARVVERKKYGRAKARRSFQFSKR